MIQDAADIPSGTELDADLCIIGGGPAGITIAKELAGTGRKIVLLAGGGRSETESGRDLFRGFVEPEQSHEPLEENRRRQWGGATSAWGGRCIPFDEIDFERRDWVPFSGWPFGKATLDPFYARAIALCEAGDYSFRATDVFPDKQAEIVADLDGPELVSWPLERWGPPTHFGKRYAKELDAAANVRVLLNAHCKHIQLAPNGGRVTHIEAAALDGGRFRVRAQCHVLACGGLENPRLLLASNDVASTGIGNHSDKLGRFYMSHLFGAQAVAKLRDPNRGFIYEFERDRKAVYCRRRFWIPAATQRENRMLNGIAFFFRPSLSQALHRNALFSAVYLAKFFLGTFKRNTPAAAFRRIRDKSAVLNSHFKIVLADWPGLVPQTLGIVRNRWFAKRRLPFVLPPKKDNRFYLYYQTEHAPNPESRVELHSERDALGVPRLLVKVRFTERDVEAVLQLHRVIRRRFEESGVGELIYDEAAVRAKLQADIREFNSSAHQIGTTRMAAEANDGVVDPDCRVHGVENLFVAGTSVFPTSGHANPTLTLVALAVRLADHLKER